MTKDEAQRELIRRWRELPLMSRQTHRQALDFAKLVAASLEFDTLGKRERVVEAWLIRDLENRDLALRLVDQRTAATKSKLSASGEGRTT